MSARSEPGAGAGVHARAGNAREDARRPVRRADALAPLLDLGFVATAGPPSVLEAFAPAPGRFRLTLVRPAMGTRVSITAVTDGPGRAEAAVGAAFEEMDRLVAILNRHDTASALSCWNREGRIAGPPPELRAVVDRALALHHGSGGAFDPTVAPLVDLLREAGERGPEKAELSEARGLVGATGIRRADARLFFDRSGMSVTLDGIAKGWIVDAMGAVLEAHGVHAWLVNAGGDIRCAGTPGPGRSWSVGVGDPEKRGNLPAVLGLRSGAVATSGSYEIYFDPARRNHHIVDGRRGASPGELASVTVVAADAASADALATTVFVLGVRSGLRLLAELPGCEALALDAEGRRAATPGWASLQLPRRSASCEIV